MNWIIGNYEVVLKMIGSFYITATLIATLTPTGKDDTFLEKVGAFFDRVGLKIKK